MPTQAATGMAGSPLPMKSAANRSLTKWPAKGVQDLGGGHDGATRSMASCPPRPAEMSADQLAQAGAGRQGGAVTDLLDRGHQRQRQQRRSQERQAVPEAGRE
jgi:hypothetical protein